MPADSAITNVTGFRRIAPYVGAVFLGALATPVAMGLSLQVLPFLSAALLYAILSAILGYIRPEPSWRWGLWTTGGMLLATLLLAAATALRPPPIMAEGSLPFSALLDFLRVTALFAYIPGVVGGCAGGYVGARFGRRRVRHRS